MHEAQITFAANTANETKCLKNESLIVTERGINISRSLEASDIGESCVCEVRDKRRGKFFDKNTSLDQRSCVLILHVCFLVNGPLRGQ